MHNYLVTVSADIWAIEIFSTGRSRSRKFAPIQAHVRASLCGARHPTGGRALGAGDEPLAHRSPEVDGERA